MSNTGTVEKFYQLIRKQGQGILSIFFTAQNKEYTQTTMDTMEPGNLKDGYWTIYFITMTMAVCKPIYYKPTEESFVSAESMSIIMPRLYSVKTNIFQNAFFWYFFIRNDLSRVDLIIKMVLEFLSNL